MLPNRVNTWEKMKNFFSLFMKESNGILGRFDVYYQQLKSVSDVEDELFNLLNVFDEDYLTKNNIDGNSYEQPILDLLGDIVGVRREIYVNFKTKNNNVTIIEFDQDALQEIEDTLTAMQGGDGYYGYITLNNYCFLEYIKLEILKKRFNGTAKDIDEIYKNKLAELGITYIWSDINGELLPGDCQIKVDDANRWNTKDKWMLYALYGSGKLTIESAGINYIYLYGGVRVTVFKLSETGFIGSPLWDDGYEPQEGQEVGVLY